jgi:hypothetical protein
MEELQHSLKSQNLSKSWFVLITEWTEILGNAVLIFIWSEKQISQVSFID